ncbi:MAG: 5'-nucleotidase [Ignavibacteria bacterium]|nr:MAG: 5'-nucleotidase [Ignavibacteria bacterium]KAF0156694.1 MAG: 5'-nucleotidase [Ignavibacteria bacterium]
MKNIFISFLLFFVTFSIAQPTPSINWISVHKTNGLYLSNLNVDKNENILINVNNLSGSAPNYVEKISKNSSSFLKHQYFNENDIKTNIIFDQEGNFYELGSHLRKYDYNGKLKWELKLFYKGLTVPDFLYVLPTKQIIVGSIWQNEYILTKYTENGDVIWDKYLPEMRNFVSQIISDKNNNLFLQGYAWIDSSKSGVYPSILKVSSNGHALWKKNNEINLGAQKFYLDINENLVTQGIEKSNSDGIVIWTSQDKIYPRDLCIDIDNNIFAVGNNIESQFIIKVDTNGKTLWKNTYSQKSAVPKCWIDYYGYCNALINNFLVKFDKYGNVIWQYNLNDAVGKNDIRYAIQVKQNIILGGNLWDGGIFIASITDHAPTNITIEKNVPTFFSLSQNYPNPFNPETTIEYSIPKAAIVELKVYDVLGREVATLVDEYKSAGNYKITFNARHLELVSNFSGRSREISSGIYFYRLQSGSFSETKKLVLLK